MKKILERIWFGIKRFFFSTFYVWVALLIGFLVGWIFGTMVGVWTFFGIILGVIAFVFGRQIYWFIWGRGDYEGRLGWFKKFILWIIGLFKK